MLKLIFPHSLSKASLSKRENLPKQLKEKIKKEPQDFLKRQILPKKIIKTQRMNMIIRIQMKIQND